MKLSIGSKKGVLVIPVYSKSKKVEFFSKIPLKEKIVHELKSYQFEGKKDEGLFLKTDSQKVLLIGMNEKFTAEDVRRAFSNACKTLKVRKEATATVTLPKDDEKTVKAAIEGLELTDYKFDKYILKKEDKDVELDIGIDSDRKFESVLKETMLVDKNVIETRNNANENSNVMTPAKIAELVKDFAKKHDLKTEILDEKEIQKQKLNLLWAVGEGSQYPPRLIIAEYNGDSKSKEKTAIVGKGITFDSGGYNLKPTNFMEDMKTDKAGAMTALGIFKSAVELKIKKNLILVIPAAENAIGSKAFKPGDMFTGYGGISVEIGSTDAEGRMVLADAVSYVQKNYKPTTIIDLATLTGAIVISLGTHVAGMFGNDAKLKKEIFEAGEETYERVWELPIYDEFREMIKSKYADVKNIGGKEGGSITGAAFIEKFIDEKTKWIHLDIAGTARAMKECYYIPEMATGRGVRLLVEWLKRN